MGWDWTLLVAACGHLALGCLCLTRGVGKPIVRAMALLAFMIFGWTFSGACKQIYFDIRWQWLDSAFTDLIPATMVHVSLAFVGRARSARPRIASVYLLFGLQSLVSLLSFGFDWARGFTLSKAATWIFIVTFVPAVAYSVVLLARYRQTVSDALEAARVRLALTAAVVGGAFALTDLANDAGLAWMPKLAGLGTFVSSSMLTAAILRFRLFLRDTRATTLVYAGIVAVVGVVAHLLLLRQAHNSLPLLVFGIGLVTVLMGLLVREAVRSWAEQRERLDRMATMGRFAAQMAHDLKNPLAALLGAAKLLQQAEKPDREMMGLIVAQGERLRTIIERYERLGRVEASREDTNVEELVTRTLKLQPFVNEKVTLTSEVQPNLTTRQLDADLVATALENLVRNAIEAMPNGGNVYVRARTEGQALVISVEDTGEGMDPRQAEHAFDEFFTTKAAGSGFGLAFVRRVAFAHGGDARLLSRRGAGTVVELVFP